MSKPRKPRKRKGRQPAPLIPPPAETARFIERGYKKLVALQGQRRAADRRVQRLTEQIAQQRRLLRELLTDVTEGPRPEAGELPTP